MAPKVAALIAQELGHDKAWEDYQVKSFTAIAKHYTCK
jgi:glycerol-3-phosphate dehydrogenase